MEAREVLNRVKSGEISVEEAEKYFKREPYEELGYAKLDLHREVGAYCAEKGIDVVCAIGDLAKSLAEGASANPQTETHWFETKADFLSAMNEIIRDGDNVLVKASHGMWFPELVEELQKF